jgi:hypothetical protein
MPFKKGQSGNLKGKPKGAVNKTTNEIREAVNEIISGNIETLRADLISLEPKERVKFLIDLMAFSLPKLQAIAVKDYTEKQEQQLIDFSKLSTETLKELIKASE